MQGKAARQQESQQQHGRKQYPSPVSAQEEHLLWMLAAHNKNQRIA